MLYPLSYGGQRGPGLGQMVGQNSLPTASPALVVVMGSRSIRESPDSMARMRIEVRRSTLRACSGVMRQRNYLGPRRTHRPNHFISYLFAIPSRIRITLTGVSDLATGRNLMHCVRSHSLPSAARSTAASRTSAS